MTRKIKNSLLITLVGLLLSIVGITLFSAASPHKTYADTYTETAAEFIKEGATYRWNDEVFVMDIINESKSYVSFGKSMVYPNDTENGGVFDSISVSRGETFIEGSPSVRLMNHETYSSISLESSFKENDWYTLTVKDYLRTFTFSGEETGKILMYSENGLSDSYVWFRKNAIRIQKLTVKRGETVLSEVEIPADTLINFGDYVSESSLSGFENYRFTDGTTDYTAETSFRTSDDLVVYAKLPSSTVNVMHDGEVIKSYTVEQGSIITVATLKKDLARDGYDLVGLSYTADGVPAELSDITVTSDLTLYAVYEESETETIGDKISDFANNVSDWLTNNTGVAISSGSLIVVAIILAVIMLTKRR